MDNNENQVNEEVKEETIEEVLDRQTEEINILKEEVELLNKKEKKKKKRKISKIIGNIIFSILFVIILFEAIIGVVNMKKINNNEIPIWYLDHKRIEDETKIEDEYDLGLYKIVRTDTRNEVKTVLKLFFIKD